MSEYVANTKAIVASRCNMLVGIPKTFSSFGNIKPSEIVVNNAPNPSIKKILFTFLINRLCITF